MKKLANADIAALVSETFWLWLWRNLPVPAWKTSSVRFRRLSLLFCQASSVAQRILYWLWPQFSDSSPRYIHPPNITWCNTPTGFSAYWCVTTINLWYFTQSGCSHLSRTVCKALFQKQNFCTYMYVCDCSTCHDCQFPASFPCITLVNWNSDKGVMYSDDKNWFPISCGMTLSLLVTRAI